ncbi:MAG: hypothetical protein OMM_04444 [Candidatus Magnetoglobus multicellularis str. Araruama]|uniref:Uncharacterized protein n=1 Tax=Candidatus Magnetoglobus multicellularis str. Araruama TaxID=890399 RepID=A0A1V1P1F0_9BACT|nr:MAG: hypothetical protein OMM_04444 [Candidatus Magnetoglobus multicellularis str. Araruama]
MIASSDGYFLKRIFEDSKLSKTSSFYGVYYLNESDTKYWLSHLETESAITALKLTKSQIDFIWKYMGGSMWEISDLLGKLISCSKKNKVSDELLNDKIQKKIEENCARFEHYSGLSEKRGVLLQEIYNCCSRDNHFKPRDMKPLVKNNIFDENELSQELNRLVQLNYLAFDPTRSTLQLQGNTMFYGLQAFIKLTGAEHGKQI